MKRGVTDIRNFLKPKKNDKKENDDDENNTLVSISKSSQSAPVIVIPNETGEQERNIYLMQSELPSTSSSRNSEVNFHNTLGNLESGPHQPRLAKFPQTKFDKLRSFSVKFYNKYNWLEYSEEQDKVFCFVCRIFGSNVRDQNEKFCETGFNKWKKLSEALNKHEKSSRHSDCAKKYIEYKKTKSDSDLGTVFERIISFNELQLSENREYMKKLIDIILVLLRQGLPLRGHREDVSSKNRGNFLEVAELFSIYDENFSKQFNKHISYCSPKVQNQIIEIIAQLSLERIVSEIKSCGFITLMADEARCFKDEQLSIVVRFAKDLEVEERFLSFINCSNSRDAQSLANIIFDFLRKSGLIDIPIVGQSYDGASVMSGKHKGLQALIREKHPSAIYIHCLAHKLNLVVVDACIRVTSAASFFNTLEALYLHFSQPGNHEKLKKVADSLGIKFLEVSSLSTTRWACRYENCKAVLLNYEAIKTTLENEIRDNQDRHVVEAVGLLACIQKAEFCICLHILNSVLLLVNVLSQYFQGKDATLGKAESIIESTLKSLEEIRNSFESIYTKIQDFAEKHDICLEPIRLSKRKRQIPAKSKDYVVESTLGHDTQIEISSESPDENHIEHWRINIHYQIMDNLIANFRERFSNLPLAKSVDALFKLNIKESQDFIENYSTIGGVDVPMLEAEVLVVKNMLTVKNLEIGLESIKKHIRKDFCPNLYKLIQIAISLPISSAGCERSFSAMRRIKNWTRTTMSQNRFSNVSIIHIEKDLVKEDVTADCVLEVFSQQDRKLKLI